MSLDYVAVRDDAGIRSLSLNEKAFLRSSALSSPALRVDGRRENDLRKIRLQLGRWDNGAECTVQWGVGTRVTAMCTADLVPPSQDRPNEGIVNFAVDLSPMSATSFRQAPPVSTAPASQTIINTRGPNFSDRDQRLLSNRILRSIERIVVIGGALDTEALVLIPGKWVWRLTVSLTVLDDGGNVVDACVLSAMAALRHYRKPQVDLSSNAEDNTASVDVPTLPTLIPSTAKEATPLPLHHTPLSVSFALIPPEEGAPSADVAALLDPTNREELVQSGSLTIAMNTHSEVCLLDFGGGCELPHPKVRECMESAAFAAKELCQQLETALEDADAAAQKEMLELLQRKNYPSFEIVDESADSQNGDTPFLQSTRPGDDAMAVDANASAGEISQAKEEAEEAYRKQALDYAQGHVASKVREDKPTRQKSSQGGSLLASLLKSAERIAPSERQPAGPSPDSAHTGEEKSNGNTDDDKPSMSKRESVAETKLPSTTATLPVSTALSDDDEEEGVTMLQSEFQSLKETKRHSSQKEPDLEPTNDGDQVDDLAMAIKKKSKKKKSKKKS